VSVVAATVLGVVAPMAVEFTGGGEQSSKDYARIRTSPL
jgi:hypothetical protein